MMKLPLNSEAASLCEALNLVRHPSSVGWFNEMHRSSIEISRKVDNAHRCAITSIYFLQASHEYPRWRQLKSDEVLIWMKGSPVKVYTLDPETGKLEIRVIGDVCDNKLANGTKPIGYQYTIPSHVYFLTEILIPESYTLFTCVVAPGFEYEDYETVEQSVLHENFPSYKHVIDRFF